jgi:hypothetical protein
MKYGRRHRDVSRASFASTSTMLYKADGFDPDHRPRPTGQRSALADVPTEAFAEWITTLTLFY